MTGSALLHKLSKQTGFVCVFPCFRNMTENTFALRFALPVWDYFLCIYLNIILADRVTLHLAGIQHMKILHTVAGKFRKSRNTFWFRATLTNNQFAFAYINGLVPAMIKEIQSTQYRNRVFTIILLVKSGFVQGAFYRQRRFGFNT